MLEWRQSLLYLHDTVYKNTSKIISKIMLLAKKLTSKWTYFLKGTPEDEDCQFFFYIIDHSVCVELLPYLKWNWKKCLTTN